jgi:choline dehydrogenase
MSERVDYVIVGAGTAGCVLAGRLSENPEVTVALLEVGGTDSNPAIWDTRIDAQRSLWAPDAKENWGYQTVPQPGLGGRAIPIARGKVLGGSSAVNAMIYIRGNRRDFDGWNQLGNPGWSYAEVLPYFKRSERYHGPASHYHGQQGPVSIIDYRDASPASHAFVEAAAALGHTGRYNDFNAGSQEAGAGLCQSTRTPERVRVTAASAFVTPNSSRTNLRLLTNVRTTRLLFERGRAAGVEYLAGGRLESIHAEREVVLSCGAFETPKLMMLSGLGPAAQLSRCDIRVVQDLVGVGKNLQDHLLVGVGFESKVPLMAPELLAEAALFTWSGAASPLLSPDLQYFFVPIQFLAEEYRTSEPGFTFIPILAQPKSRGSVMLASHDPRALARVDMQYLSVDEDLAVLEHGIRYARELAHTKPFDGLRGRELSPGKRVTSASELRAYVRRVATTVWHPSGTCRMGTEHDAVVDSELRVHGVEGLRIVDASIMPKLISGNPNAAIMMIAERAADLILPSRSERRPDRIRPDGSRDPGEYGRGSAEGRSISADIPTIVSVDSGMARHAAYREKVAVLLRGVIPERGPQKHLYALVARQLGRAQSGISSAICVATCAAFGGSGERALPFAAAIELLQNAFSVHERIGSDEKSERHDPSLNRQHDVPIAVNVGDAMSALGVQLSRQNVRFLEPELAARVLDEFDRMATETVEGRAMELGASRQIDRGTAEDYYLLTALKKTIWGGFIGPARLGALLAKPEITDLDRFNRFGYFLGLALQIRDDLRQLVDAPAPHGSCESTADAPVSGKSMTLTLAHLVDHCDAAERRQLEGFLGQRSAKQSPPGASWLNDAMRTHGSVAYAREAARRFAEEARREFEAAYAGAFQAPDLNFLRSLLRAGEGAG